METALFKEFKGYRDCVEETLKFGRKSLSAFDRKRFEFYLSVINQSTNPSSHGDNIIQRWISHIYDRVKRRPAFYPGCHIPLPSTPEDITPGQITLGSPSFLKKTTVVFSQRHRQSQHDNSNPDTSVVVSDDVQTSSRKISEVHKKSSINLEPTKIGNVEFHTPCKEPDSTTTSNKNRTTPLHLPNPFYDGSKQQIPLPSPSKVINTSIQASLAKFQPTSKSNQEHGKSSKKVVSETKSDEIETKRVYGLRKVVTGIPKPPLFSFHPPVNKNLATVTHGRNDKSTIQSTQKLTDKNPGPSLTEQKLNKQLTSQKRPSIDPIECTAPKQKKNDKPSKQSHKTTDSIGDGVKKDDGQTSRSRHTSRRRKKGSDDDKKSHRSRSSRKTEELSTSKKSDSTNEKSNKEATRRHKRAKKDGSHTHHNSKKIEVDSIALDPSIMKSNKHPSPNRMEIISSNASRTDATRLEIVEGNETTSDVNEDMPHETLSMTSPHVPPLSDNIHVPPLSEHTPSESITEGLEDMEIRSVKSIPVQSVQLTSTSSLSIRDSNLTKDNKLSKSDDMHLESEQEACSKNDLIIETVPCDAPKNHLLPPDTMSPQEKGLTLYETDNQQNILMTSGNHFDVATIPITEELPESSPSNAVELSPLDNDECIEMSAYKAVFNRDPPTGIMSMLSTHDEMKIGRWFLLASTRFSITDNVNQFLAIQHEVPYNSDNITRNLASGFMEIASSDTLFKLLGNADEVDMKNINFNIHSFCYSTEEYDDTLCYFCRVSTLKHCCCNQNRSNSLAQRLEGANDCIDVEQNSSIELPAETPRQDEEQICNDIDNDKVREQQSPQNTNGNQITCKAGTDPDSDRHNRITYNLHFHLQEEYDEKTCYGCKLFKDTHSFNINSPAQCFAGICSGFPISTIPSVSTVAQSSNVQCAPSVIPANGGPVIQCRRQNNTTVPDQIPANQICQICNKAFLHPATLWNHMADRHGQNYRCKTCHVIIRRKSNMVRHQKNQKKKNHEGIEIENSDGEYVDFEVKTRKSKKNE